MLTGLTLGDIRASLSWLVPDPDEFLLDLNAARSAIFNNGLWEGVIRKVSFPGNTTGVITLDPFFQSIIGATVNKCPQMVFNQYHQYIESGPGTIDPTLPGFGPLIQMGDSFVTNVADHTPGQQLRFRISNPADAAKVLRIFGTGTTNQPIFTVADGSEGQDVALVSPVVTFPTNLNLFLGIQKPLTLGTVSVYSWNGVVETLLSVYQPWETRPHYARYQTGTYDPTCTIDCLCRLGYYPLYSDTDFCVPDDINAIELAMQAINQQHTRHYSDAAAAWKQSYDQLNSEVRTLRGKAQPSVTLIGPMSNRTRLKTN